MAKQRFDDDDADDDDDRPVRRPRNSRDDDDDEDDRPTRRRRDVEDDYDDAPRSRRGPQPDGMGTAAMIIGIISCVFAVGCLAPYIGCVVGPLSIVGGITAVILGFVAKGKNPKSGKAKAGIITGFVAIGLDVLMVVIGLIIGVGMAMVQQP